MNSNSVLIASPVNKNAKILKEFLRSLDLLEKDELKISYCFADDNDEEESSALLKDFILCHAEAGLVDLRGIHKNTDYEKNDHTWTREKTQKVAHIKNLIIKDFLKGQYSHLFFIDADLILHPRTLMALLESDRDIVANIFWTKWQQDSAPLPQVWLKDFYTLYDDDMLSPKTPEQINQETISFLASLYKPGVYRVGGLGACTLIRRRALEAGVNFDPIYNLSFWGEDRSFCIRAAALGFELYVNTMYPAHHIYRPEDLDCLPVWYAKT